MEIGISGGGKSNETIKEEYHTMVEHAQEKYGSTKILVMILAYSYQPLIRLDSSSMMVPRNCGCEPRVICKPLSIDHLPTTSVAPFPLCIEIHQCGGCCHEAQFPCVPVEQEPVTFSPVSNRNIYHSFYMRDYLR